MESNLNNSLEAFAKSAQSVLIKLNADIEAAKKSMTPEQKAEFDRQMEGNDIKGAEKDLQNALKKYKETIDKLC